MDLLLSLGPRNNGTRIEKLENCKDIWIYVREFVVENLNEDIYEAFLKSRLLEKVSRDRTICCAIIIYNIYILSRIRNF